MTYIDIPETNLDRMINSYHSQMSKYKADKARKTQ